MTDIFKDLPRLSWRGLEVPVAERSVSFDQELVRHKFAYRDDELLESLGRHNWKFEYTIPFREDIAKGPYKNLYVAAFTPFLQACRDRSEGELVDPMLGVYTARVESVSIQTDVDKRDGEDVHVVFVHSPALDDTEKTKYKMTGRLGAEITQRFGEIETVFNPADAEIIDGLDMDIFSVIGRIGSQVSVFANRIDNTLASYESKIDRVIDRFVALNDLLNNPQNMPVIRSALRAKDAVARARFQSFTSGKTITTLKTDRDWTPASLALYIGMTLNDLLKLNANLPQPTVPSGTTVFYFQKV